MRIAIKEIESWLLADIEGFSEFTGVSKANFPLNPELLPDVKKALIHIVRKSRKRSIKEDILPLKNAEIGPNYNNRLLEFLINNWDVSRAMLRSQSLKRAYNHLNSFQ